jgi:hypothetical protein
MWHSASGGKKCSDANLKCHHDWFYGSLASWKSIWIDSCRWQALLLLLFQFRAEHALTTHDAIRRQRWACDILVLWLQRHDAMARVMWAGILFPSRESLIHAPAKQRGFSPLQKGKNPFCKVIPLTWHGPMSWPLLHTLGHKCLRSSSKSIFPPRLKLAKFTGSAKVDCSGKSLRVLREIWGFGNPFSSKKLIRLLKFHEAFTQMSFKIVKYSVRPSDFFPSNLL